MWRDHRAATSQRPYILTKGDPVKHFLAVFVALCSMSAYAIDINDTRLLTDPAVTKDHIAFAYANDLWVANLDGSNVRRLTSHPGIESGPRFSPDGSLIAFTGRYDGNVDVYVVPTAGGVPRRLTWHPLNDIVLGFTPDGSSVLFSSPRARQRRVPRQLPSHRRRSSLSPLPRRFPGLLR